MRTCLSQATPKTSNYSEFLDVWQQQFRCLPTDDDTVGLCGETISERAYPPDCRCDGLESLNDLALPANINYIYDSATAYGTALNWLTSPTLCQRLQSNTTDFCEAEDITSANLVAALKQISFNGLTGNVNWNGTAPNRRRSVIDVFQFNATGNVNQVGFWNNTGPFLGADLLRWKALPKSQGGNGQNVTSTSTAVLTAPGATSVLQTQAVQTSTTSTANTGTTFVPLSSNSPLNDA